MANRTTEKALAEAQRELHGLQQNRAQAIKTLYRDPGNEAIIARLDGEIAAVQARIRQLRGVTPGELLAELDTQIAGTEATLRQLNEQKSAAVVAKLQRDPEGADKLKKIEKQIDEAEARLRTTRQQRDKLSQRIAADRAADRQKDAEARPLRLAELHRERADLAEMAATAAAGFASAFNALRANGAALGELLDDQGARNFFSAPVFRGRAANALARLFAINPNAPLTAANSLFGIASSAIGAQAHWTLTEWEQPGLDNLVPFYKTEAEAEAARLRLELQASQTIAVPLHGAFVLVPFEHLFGDKASARRAAGTARTPMTILAHDGGYVLIPQRFTGEVA